MKVGDNITVKYLSAYKKTQIGFVKIKKIGHKYIYGITLWISKQEGIIVEGHDIKYTISNIVVYPGIRQDLRDTLDKYDADYRQWQKDRNDRDREVDWEIRNLKQKMLGEWEKDNPMPQPPELPLPN